MDRHCFMELCFEMKLQNIWQGERSPEAFTRIPNKWISFHFFLGMEKSFITSGSPIFSLRDILAWCLHIKAIKVSSSTVGLNQVSMFMGNLWTMPFLPSFWQARLTVKSLYISHFKWQASVAKTQGQFLSLLLEYFSTHLHMHLRTICFLTRFTVQYGTMNRGLRKKSSVTLYNQSFAFLID